MHVVKVERKYRKRSHAHKVRHWADIASMLTMCMGVIMIKDLVKSAINIKMDSSARNDLISKGEFSYAVGLAFSILKEDKSLVDEVLAMGTIAQIKTRVVEKVQKAYDDGDYERKFKTLFYMIIECKLDGEMTEELRELFLMGYNS